MRAISVNLPMCFALFTPVVVGACACGCGSSKAAVGTGPKIGTTASTDARGVPTSTGPKYYLSDCQTGALPACIPGDDSNDGTTPDAPWKTFKKALDSLGDSTPPGQQYFFARGGSFQHSTNVRLSDVNSMRDNPILFDAYTPSWASDSSNPPIITVTAANVSAFDFQNGGNATHDEGYVIRNLDLRGSGKAQYGISLYNDVDYVVMENLSISGFAAGLQVGTANAPAAQGSDTSNDNYVLRNSKIFNNFGMGFLGSGDNFIIENNVFDNNGFAEAVFNHNIYVNSETNATNSVIRKNTLTHSTMVNGKCSGVSLVVHGATNGLLIENNRIQEDVGAVTGGCYGIAVDPGGYGHSEGFPGTVIRGNWVINVGNVGIGASACPNCVIENNVVIEEQAGIGFNGIMIPIQVRNPGDAAEGNATIRNNSIYLSPAVDYGTGIYMGYEGSSHLVVSNAIHYLGSGNPFYNGWTCFDTTGLAPSAFRAFDNNLCDFPNARAARWEKTAGALQDWQTKSNGLDAASRQDDPRYRSPGVPDYDLSISSADSPAIDAGHANLSSPVDITGRTRDTKPDIGAYERN